METSTISRSGTPNVDRNSGWVNRFVSDVRGEKKFSDSEKLWTPIPAAYLKKNPYPPQNIFVQRLRDFVDSLPADTRTEGARCLYYFYAYVCKSRKHCDVAQRIGREAAMVADGVAAENKNTGDSRDGPTAVAALTAARGKEPGTVNTAGKGAGAGKESHTKKELPTDRPSVWVDASAAQLIQESMPQQQARMAAENLRALFARNSCHPRAIAPEILSLRHTLRHRSAQGYATHLLEQGVGIAQIQSLMGHANLKTTQIYAHVSQEQLGKIRSPLASLKRKSKNGTSKADQS